MNAASIMTSLLVSSIGYVAFAYGRRQRRFPHMSTGLTMMVFPYFVDSPLMMLVLMVGLIALMWLLVRLGW